MRSPGIHLRLLVAALILLSATTAALGYIGVNIIHQFVQSRFDERIRFLARYVALNAELGILIDERALLHRLAENLLAETDVVGVTIADSAGEPLAQVEKRSPGPHAVVEEPVEVKISREESIAYQWPEGGDGSPKSIGTVRIVYSTQEIDRLLGTIKRRFLQLSAFFAGAAVLVFFFISRSLVAPLTRLVVAVRKVAGGEMGVRVAPGKLPETRKLAEAFNAMLDSLEESGRALETVNREMMQQKTFAELGRFSMMVAHEVKNPLAIIKSSLDLLKREVAPDSKSGGTLVAYMEDEIRRLNRLIEDFLGFARPAAPNFRAVDVNGLVSQCVSRMRAPSAPVEIDEEIPARPFMVRGDPDLLARSVGNVIKNAVEACGGEGRVAVSAEILEDAWYMEISDQGEGIPEENLPRIFEPFFTTRSKGTGLGLAFVSQVVEAHGGGIEVKNRTSGGCAFRIELPANGPKGGAVPDTGSDSRVQRCLRS